MEIHELQWEIFVGNIWFNVLGFRINKAKLYKIIRVYIYIYIHVYYKHTYYIYNYYMYIYIEYIYNVAFGNQTWLAGSPPFFIIATFDCVYHIT